MDGEEDVKIPEQEGLPEIGNRYFLPEHFSARYGRLKTTLFDEKI